MGVHSQCWEEIKTSFDDYQEDTQDPRRIYLPKQQAYIEYIFNTGILFVQNLQNNLCIALDADIPVHILKAIISQFLEAVYNISAEELM